MLVRLLTIRKVYIGGIVCDPTQEWVVQVARNVTDCEDGFLPEGSRLSHDRDPVFGKKFKETLAATGVRTVKLPPKSPNLNAFCERFNRTIKEECLDHFVICSQAHLELLVREFCAYYHEERPHQSLGNRPILEPARKGTGVIRVKDRLGGYLKHYYRKTACQVSWPFRQGNPLLSATSGQRHHAQAPYLQAITTNSCRCPTFF